MIAKISGSNPDKGLRELLREFSFLASVAQLVEAADSKPAYVWVQLPSEVPICLFVRLLRTAWSVEAVKLSQAT